MIEHEEKMAEIRQKKLDKERKQQEKQAHFEHQVQEKHRQVSIMLTSHTNLSNRRKRSVKGRKWRKQNAHSRKTKRNGRSCKHSSVRYT